MAFVTVREKKTRKKFHILLLIVAILAAIFIAVGVILIFRDVPKTDGAYTLPETAAVLTTEETAEETIEETVETPGE